LAWPYEISLILFQLKLDSGHDRSRTYVDDPYTAPDQKYVCWAIFYATFFGTKKIST